MLSYIPKVGYLRLTATSKNHAWPLRSATLLCSGTKHEPGSRATGERNRRILQVNRLERLDILVYVESLVLIGVQIQRLSFHDRSTEMPF